MAAQDTTISLPSETWTSISANSISAITAQNVGNGDIWIQATTANTAPSGGAQGILLKSGLGIDAGKSLADLFPGLTSPAYVFAFSDGNSGAVFASHAA